MAVIVMKNEGLFIWTWGEERKTKPKRLTKTLSAAASLPV